MRIDTFSRNCRELRPRAKEIRQRPLRLRRRSSRRRAFQIGYTACVEDEGRRTEVGKVWESLRRDRREVGTS